MSALSLQFAIGSHKVKSTFMDANRRSFLMAMGPAGLLPAIPGDMLAFQSAGSTVSEAVASPASADDKPKYLDSFAGCLLIVRPPTSFHVQHEMFGAEPDSFIFGQGHKFPVQVLSCGCHDRSFFRSSLV